jgi:hypothetical protein
MSFSFLLLLNIIQLELASLSPNPLLSPYASKIFEQDLNETNIQNPLHLKCGDSKKLE